MDFVVAEQSLVIHEIEVKLDAIQEAVEQLASYIRSKELNHLWLAILDCLQQWALQTVRETDLRIGVITVNPTTRTINLVKEATML